MILIFNNRKGLICQLFSSKMLTERTRKEEAYSISGEEIYRNSDPGDRKRGSCPNLFR